MDINLWPWNRHKHDWYAWFDPKTNFTWRTCDACNTHVQHPTIGRR